MNSRNVLLRRGALLAICMIATATCPAHVERLRFTRSLHQAAVGCLSQLFWKSHWHREPDWAKDMIADAAVAHANLKENGEQDYIFLIEGEGWCGTDGCPLLIGEMTPGGTCDLLYDDRGGDYVTVLPARDNGYHRLYTPCEARFDGRQYQQLNPECPTATIWR